MMPAGDPVTEIARRLCLTHPDAPTRTLARRLVKESNGAVTLEQARKRIGRQFGVHGKQNRKKIKAAAPRARRKAGEILAMPPSMAEPWTPHVMRVTGPVGILSDVHVPYHSEIAVAAAVGFLKEQNLAGLLLNGDIADFYAISRYMKDPKQRDFKGDQQAVRDVLEWSRHELPGIPLVYKLCNPD